jgi:hypothetical protein
MTAMKKTDSRRRGNGIGDPGIQVEMKGPGSEKEWWAIELTKLTTHGTPVIRSPSIPWICDRHER